jgi:RHS repeat-associated protein
MKVMVMSSGSRSAVLRRVTSLTLSLVMAVGLVNAVAVGPAAAASSAPTVNRGTPVPGAAAAKIAARPKPASSVSAVPLPTTKLPAATFSGALPSGVAARKLTTDASKAGVSGTVAGPWKALGKSGISLAAAAAGNGSAVQTRGAALPVASASVGILSAAAEKAYGLTGLVLSVKRTDGTDTAGPLAVQVPNGLLAGMYGADFASRVRWVQVTPPAAGSKSKLATTQAVASVADTADKATVLSPQVSSTSMLLTPAGAPVSSTGTGSFAATSLTPATTWQVSAQTGDFSWSYPMRTPPAAAGPSPDLAFNYDSQSVDGETGSTNNQPSAVGEGWSQSGGGYIERSYVSCTSDDGSSGPVTTSGDLCWKTDNATISFGGHSGSLVKDTTTGVWKLQSDDGSRIQHLAGTAAGCAANGTYDTDCWRVTTTDGTQYYFGLNQLPGWASGKATTNSTWTVPVFGNDAGEPCHASTFAASSCVQAWRWNLDYVVDTNGNAEALYYDAETNKYAQNGGATAGYTRGGQLDHIDYGFTTGNAYAANAASDRVLFGYAADGRCSDATLANCTAEAITGGAAAPANPTYYPDVPFDQYCTGSSCPTLLSPTFWTDGMLSTVTTSVLTGGAYANVDVWSLSHSFPSPGDGTNAALWLTQIGHTGYSGGTSLTEPATVFTGATMQNRVWAVDGLAPLDKYRITSIATSTGAVVSVNYSAQQCTPAGAAAIEAAPQSNTNRCFPQWWSPQVVPAQAAQEDLFHKYVVTSVISNPETGGGTDQSQETDYLYTGTPAWRYDTSPLTPNADRTWSVFAGYNAVEIRQGSAAIPAAQQTTDYTFFQGMDGDRAAPAGGTKTVYVTGSTTVRDSLWLAGQTRETTTLTGGGGTALTDTITTPWASAVTANDGVNTARMVGTADVSTTAPVSTGGNRTTDTATTFDPTYGLPLTVDATSSDAPPKCTTTSYAPANTTAWLVGLPDEVATAGVDCANLATAVYPAAAVSDIRTSYDGAAWGAAASKGNATKTQEVDSYTGSTASTAHWVTSAQVAYDSMGRATQTTDVLGHTTSTAYTPAATAVAGSGPTTSETSTNTAPFSWTSTTAYNPAWGVETSETDANGKVTTAVYDALGRRTGVWLPDNPQASNPGQASMAYTYFLSTTTANAVETRTLGNNAIVDSFALFDGLGRPVQSQSGAEGGGAVVSDNWYDSQGRVSVTNAPYWTSSVSPSSTLFVPTTEAQIPSETQTLYDGAGRTTATVLDSLGAERYRTTTAYPGADRVDTTPPTGGTPTTSITNSLGQQTTLIQYLAATPLSTATQEATTYGYDAAGAMTSMTDPAGNHWAWAFNVLGQQTAAVDPDTGTTTSSYDDAGNLLTSTDARGKVLAYSYDALNRKTGEYLTSTGSTGSLLDSWSYDTIAKGQLTSSSSYTGSTAGHPGLAYTSAVTGYDAGYRATGTTVSIPTGAPAFAGTSYTTSSAYDTGGGLASITYPAEGGLPAERLRTSYDGFGNFASLHGTSSYVVTAYTAIGQVSEYQRIGTTTLWSDYGHDLATGAVTNIIQTANTGSSYTTPANATYAYDNAGNVTSVATTSNTLATDTQCFSYDYLRNLTSAWTPSSNNCATAKSATALGGPAPYWTDYAVSPQTGNRTSTVEHSTTGTATTDTFAYPVAGAVNPHAVQSVVHTGGTTGTSTYGYDADGDTTARPGQTLGYDNEGKIATVTAGSASESNVYDASGNLLLQTDSTTGSTLFLGATELHETTGSSTASAVRTYTANGTPIAERTTAVGVSGSKLTWLATDAQGTVDLQVDAVTGVVASRLQDPFGQARGTSTAAWASDGHGFLNATTGALTSLTQLGARMYDASLGRFLSVDPVLSPSDPQQNNGYSYAHNSPVSMSDPTGLDPNIASSCSSLACRNQMYSGSSGNAPAAAGNTDTYIKVSPHVVVSSNDPQLKSMQAAYKKALKMFNHAPTSPSQEMNVWAEACIWGDPLACDPNFRSGIVAPATQWTPNGTMEDVYAGDVFAVAPNTPTEPIVVVELNAPDYGGANAHWLRAQGAGKVPDTLEIYRPGAAANRAAALKGIPTQTGFDRDEVPPAMFREGGGGASVEYVSPSDNRGLGSWIGNQLKDYPDGTLVRINVSAPEIDIPAP